MRITILTLFPGMFDGPFRESMVKKAQEKNLVHIDFVDIRKFGIGAHRVVDDKPYGGGVGMVMRADVLHKAIESAKDPALCKAEQKVILMDARGEMFSQKKAKSFSMIKHLIIVCGHYEGVDERVLGYIDEAISIGPFVLTGGEIPAMLIADATVRLIKGVLKTDATENESFSKGLEEKLEHPQYTRPAVYNNQKVPEILVSGHHQQIAQWKKTKAK